MTLYKKWTARILSALTIVALLVFGIGVVKAQNADELLQEIARLEQEVQKLKNQANTLNNQIAQFDTQIYLTNLKIEDTEERIKLLGGRIDQLEGSLDSLSTAFYSRVNETYRLNRLENAFIFLITSQDLSEAVIRYHYLKRIQEADRSLLVRLQTAQNTYQEEKTDQEELQDELEEQEAVLGAQKAAKADLLAVTKNNEARYQELLEQAKAELASFKRFAASQGGATILENQTKCDGWGCYYNQRDSQWGNMSLGGTGYLMKDSGCFVTSIAMMASHYGKNIKPSDIAALSAVFTSQGYLKWEPFNVNGVEVSIWSDSVNNLDSLLSSGKPVIAKLSYSYGDHFIVILRKDGDNYIMHDPFMENGNSSSLTDKYSVSDITSLRLASFN